MPKTSLKINAISNWISLFAHIIIGFLLTPFIIRSLDRKGYGIWTLICSFVGYYGLINLGIGSAITRYIARYTAQKDIKSLNQVVSTALAIFVITSALILILTFLFGDLLANFLNVEKALHSNFIYLLWIICIVVGISFFGDLFSSIVIAREHYFARNMFVVCQELLRVVLTVLFIKMGWGIIGVGLAFLISEFCGMVFSAFLLRIFASDIKISINSVNLMTLKMLFVYGGVTTIISIADILRINIDSFVIAKYITIEAVAIYGVGSLIIKYMTKVITSTMTVLRPRFASLEGSNNMEQLKKLFLRSLSISAFLSFGLSFCAITFGPKFILIWIGSDYDYSIYILSILATSYAFGLSQTPAINLMYSINKHHYYAFFTILEALANLSLSIFLAGQYGIIGVAMGTAIPMIIMKCFIMPVYVSRIIDISLSEYLKSFIKPLLTIIIFLYIFYIFDFDTLILNNNLFLYFSIVSVFGILYLSIFYFFCFKKSIKLKNAL